MALEQLGPYRISPLLGRGRMGAVYEGVHVDTGERSAVKILSIAYADDAASRAPFASEIETLQKLRHPNIVQLIGFGEQDGVLFYSMELVLGKSLHSPLHFVTEAILTATLVPVTVRSGEILWEGERISVRRYLRFVELDASQVEAAVVTPPLFKRQSLVLKLRQ